MKQQKKVLENVYHGILQNITNHTYICCYPGCSEIAINSHIFQQARVLSQIQENGFLYEFLPKRHFDWENLQFKEIQEFKQVSVKRCNSYKAFCSNHDTTLFQNIETTYPIDFSSYNVKFLFLFKMLTILNRRKEILKDFQQRALNSETIKNHDIGGKLNSMHNWTLDGIQSPIDFNRKYIEALYIDVNDSKSESFDIEVFSFNERHCYCCHFSMCTENLSQCYTLIFPYDGQLKVIIAKLKEENCKKYDEIIEKWAKINESDINKELTICLIESEYIGVSPALHKRNRENNNLGKFLDDKFSVFENAMDGVFAKQLNIDYTFFD